jgi:putative heme transporter
LIRGRLLRRRASGDRREGEFVEIDPRELTGLFAAPQWLRDLGFTAWLLVGVVLLLVGLIWILSLTQVIVIPVIVAGVVAAVAEPLVSWLKRHHVPRGVGALLVLLAIVAAGGLAMWLILHGITSQSSGISDHLTAGADKIEGWLKDIGVSDSKAQGANHDMSSGTSTTFHALLGGVLGGVEKLSSLAFFIVMAILALLFLLLDGPTIRTWSERHMGVPPDESLRGYSSASRSSRPSRRYWWGRGAGARRAAGRHDRRHHFSRGYVPYLGAWTAGAFSVLLALGGAGPEAAGGMIVIQLLSNGPLQQLVQPVAYGAALGIHPLAVLVVTIAGGALFGAVGLILAAPITSAIVRISADLSRAHAEAAAATPATQAG